MAHTVPTPNHADDPMRGLLAAVLEALTLPYDTPDYDRRILDRAAEARTVATAALAEDPRDIAWNVDYLRGKLRAERADAEQEAVRRSVDRAFPAVAEFLDRERAVRGSNRRTVTIQTRDFGPVTIPEPSWCAGKHPDGGYRIDITHVGPDRPLTVPTRSGPADALITALESRPFVDDPFLRRPFVSVAIDSDWHPTDVAGLEAMAAALTAHADALRDRAHELAVILAGGEGR